MDDPKFCLIQFKYSYKTVPGEDIRVVGSIPQLGNWDVYKSEKLVTSKLDFPVWKTKENILVRQNKEIDYKYVIFRNNKLVRWESLPNNCNRKIHVKNIVRLVLWDSQDCIGTRIEKFTKYSSSYDTEEEDDYLELPPDKPKQTHNNLDMSPVVCPKHKIDSVIPRCLDELNDLNYDFVEENEQILEKTKDSEKIEVELNGKDQIIMCCFYLPFIAVKNEFEIWDLSLTNEAFPRTLWTVSNKENVKWIGMLKNFFQIDNDIERERLVSLLYKKYNMHAIKVSQDSFQKLNFLINGIFDPLFHYITVTSSFNSGCLHFEEYWKSYKEFNEIVAKQIMQLINENSLVFLHDYHFLLVPSLIYFSCYHFNEKLLQKLSIGMFIHAPFPSFELFIRFPYREEILKSMMNCSIIGFHTFDCSRNFLNCAKRLLFINCQSTIKGDLVLSYYGRNVIIRVKNITSDPGMVEKETNSPEFKKLYQDILTRHKGKYIYVSIDNMLFLAGVIHKLEGYRRFLREIGDNYKQNVYLQYICCSINDTITLDNNDSISHEQSQKEMLQHIHKIADEIQKEFEPGVLELAVKEITYTERLAVLASGKCFVRTCKRESFSLGIYEFLTLKMIFKDEKEVGYILSEFSGVNSSLAGTIKINPFDFISIKKAFLEAFQVHFDKINYSSVKEKDFLHVKKYRTSDWLNSFLKDLKNAKGKDDENAYYIGSGIGLNFRLMKINSEFKELNRNDLYEDYDKAKKRLLFFDYEGTLPPAIYKDDDHQSKGQKPHFKILSLLQQLTHDKRNLVFIVTGRETKLVSDWFSSVSDLGLASEHGFMYRYSSNTCEPNKWYRMLPDFVCKDWKEYCIDQFLLYTDRCEGSFIEVKEASVVWQYRDCDPELGKLYANVITRDLEGSLKYWNLNIVNGKGYVEILPSGVNKGAFVSFIIKEEIKHRRTPDFILAIGDDTADEEMFKYLISKKSEIKKHSKNFLKVHTATVGKKPSRADSYVDSPVDVKNIIESFVQISCKKRSLSSSYDMKSIVTDTTLELSMSSQDK